MINVFISIFIAVLIGVGFIGPIASQINTAAAPCPPSDPAYATYTNYSGGVCVNANNVSQSTTSLNDLYSTSNWGATTLKMVPGFYALVILGTVIGGLFAVFRQVGIQ